MHLVKVLKRKDATSVVVAVVLAFILLPVLTTLTSDLANYLSGITDQPSTEWRQFIVQPLIGAFLQVVLLEAILRVAIYLRPFFVRRGRVAKAGK